MTKKRVLVMKSALKLLLRNTERDFEFAPLYCVTGNDGKWRKIRFSMI